MSTVPPVLQNFIGGSYVDPADGRTSPVVDPSTGEAYAQAPISSAQDVAAAMTSAEAGFGAVWINTHLPFVSEMPHGGYGHSGYGKDLSMYGFEEYTRIKHVMSYLG